MTDEIEVQAEVIEPVVNLAKAPEPAIAYTLPVATVNNVSEIDAFVTAIERFFGGIEIDVYDQGHVKQLKDVRADINKVAAAIDKKRIAMNKEIKAATSDAEKVLKDLHARVKAVYDKTGRQIDEADELARQAKRNILEREYEAQAPDLMELIPLEVFVAAEPKLMQKAWSGGKACDVLSDMVARAVHERQLIRDSNLEFYLDADKTYCQTLDIAKAFDANARKVEERKAREEHEAASNRLDEAIGRAHAAVSAQPAPEHQPTPQQAPQQPVKTWQLVFTATKDDAVRVRDFLRTLPSVEGKSFKTIQEA